MDIIYGGIYIIQKEIRIHSLKLANILINDGYILLRTEINIKYPMYKDFIFLYDDHITEIISKYKH